MSNGLNQISPGDLEEPITKLINHTNATMINVIKFMHRRGHYNNISNSNIKRQLIRAHLGYN
jgi:hypothetical protein